MANDMIKVGLADISVGQPLAWALYDRSGRLVLERGMLVQTEGQLASWIDRGVFRKVVAHTREMTAPPPANHAPKPEPYRPFAHLDDIQGRLEKAFALLHSLPKKAVGVIEKLAAEIQTLCRKTPDAAIGFIHLAEDFGYTIRHPVKKAIIADMIARRLRMPPEQRLTLLKATLTCDISVIELQERLHKQDAPLTPEQQAIMHNHPQASMQRLQQAGISEREWLDAVLQHHEFCDGSGYPMGLTADAIGTGAKLICLADAYCAMVSSKAYREKVDSRDALKDFFLTKGKQRDETMCLTLIKELTAFPPGTVVEIANGEIAVVTHRTENPASPLVSSIINTSGDMYLKPYQRDTAVEEFAIRKLAALPAHTRPSLPHIWDARLPA
jgi:HD-GYP domain-containing protein (c-di-GMP phosphodiesterase class II)